MQIRVDKLRKNLSLLQSVVPRKATLPIITHVRLRDGQLTGTDLETTVTIDLPEAEGEALLLPLRPALELLKFVAGDEILTLAVTPKPNSKNNLVKLIWQGGKAAYEVKDVKDYPEITLKEPRSSSSLNGDRLIAALVAALPYCATESARPVLTGVTLYLGNVLQVAGADGYRLSYQSLNQSCPLDEKIIIPAGTVSILEHLWSKEPSRVGLASDLVSQIAQARPLELSLGDYTEAKNGDKPVPKTMLIRFGDLTLISKLIIGTPPDHLALLNDFREPIKVKFLAPELYRAVKRVQGIAQAGSGIVRLKWTETQMTVSAQNAETGEVQAVLTVESGSNPGRTALNVHYLLDYLAGKEGLVTLGKAEGNAPALFHYGSQPIVAVMPMQVQWEDEKPATPAPKETSGNPQSQNGKETAGEASAVPEEAGKTGPVSSKVKASEAAASVSKTKPRKQKPASSRPPKK